MYHLPHRAEMSQSSNQLEWHGRIFCHWEGSEDREYVAGKVILYYQDNAWRFVVWSHNPQQNPVDIRLTDPAEQLDVSENYRRHQCEDSRVRIIVRSDLDTFHATLECYEDDRSASELLQKLWNLRHNRPQKQRTPRRIPIYHDSGPPSRQSHYDRPNSRSYNNKAWQKQSHPGRGGCPLSPRNPRFDSRDNRHSPGHSPVHRPNNSWQNRGSESFPRQNNNYMKKENRRLSENNKSSHTVSNFYGSSRPPSRFSSHTDSPWSNRHERNDRLSTKNRSFGHNPAANSLKRARLSQGITSPATVAPKRPNILRVSSENSTPEASSTSTKPSLEIGDEKDSKRSSITGFRNLGNTCYMNSVLQAMLGLDSFATDLLTAQSQCNKLLLPNSLFRRIVQLLKARLLTPKAADCYEKLLKDVKLALGDHTKSFLAYSMQDAHEFFIKLVDALKENVERVMAKHTAESASSEGKESASPTPTLNPVRQNFEIVLQETYTCTKCQQSVSRPQVYYDISLNLRRLRSSGPSHSLQDMLDFNFQPEAVEYKCPSCGNEESSRDARFAQLPRVLVLHLKRYQQVSGKLGKNESPVVIPRYVTLQSYCESNVLPPPHFTPMPINLDSLTDPPSPPPPPDDTELSSAKCVLFGPAEKPAEDGSEEQPLLDTTPNRTFGCTTDQDSLDAGPVHSHLPSAKRVLFSDILPDSEQRQNEAKFESADEQNKSMEATAATTIMLGVKVIMDEPTNASGQCEIESDGSKATADFGTDMLLPELADSGMYGTTVPWYTKNSYNSAPIDLKGGHPQHCTTEGLAPSEKLESEPPCLESGYDKSNGGEDRFACAPTSREEEEMFLEQALQQSLKQYEEEEEKKIVDPALLNLSCSEEMELEDLEEEVAEDSVAPERSREDREMLARNAETGEMAHSYRLTGVITHMGNMNAGHYTACVYQQKEDKWILCNDERVVEMSETGVCRRHQTCGYIFFYCHRSLLDLPPP